ncbi:ACT domain-containing protein [Verrucomicrobiaceae bacterium 227]
MISSLVLTVLGADRPGLVGAIADLVSQHGGSWQESRMARLSGQFAGILRVECPAENRAALESDLTSLKTTGLSITVVHDECEEASAGPVVAIEITGHDEPGIVKRVASTFARLGVNVEELNTSLESAPMAGHLLFCTRGKVRLPDDLSSQEFIEALEKVGSDLTVDIH